MPVDIPENLPALLFWEMSFHNMSIPRTEKTNCIGETEVLYFSITLKNSSVENGVFMI
jgi:hypothetical protein